MNDPLPPAPPPLPGPAVGAAAPVRDPAISGCLKWGLVGCSALAVVLIVGLILFLRKAPELMDRLLGAAGDQVVAAAAPEVTAQQKEDFHAAFREFVEGAKAQRVKPEQIRGLQSQIVEALRDGKITPEELKSLTEALRSTAGR
jgi:hypothetical protein